MTVKELINKLMECDWNAQVVVWEQGLIHPVRITKSCDWVKISADR